jgi:hypothetical protein
MGKIIRQGDVILREIRELPQYAERVYTAEEFNDVIVTPDTVVVHGESGHKHVLRGVKTYMARWYHERAVYVVVEKPTVLRHDEHPAIEIPRGIYVVTHIRDYALNRVID